MTKFSKFVAVCGCCCGLALVGCASSRHVDASGAECGANCQEKCCASKTVDVQANESDCCKAKAGSTVDVQATDCSAAKASCSGSSCSKQ